MNTKISEWKQHPLTKSFIKVLENNRETALQKLLNLPSEANKEQIFRLLERVKTINEILDFNQLLLGEIEED